MVSAVADYVRSLLEDLNYMLVVLFIFFRCFYSFVHFVLNMWGMLGSYFGSPCKVFRTYLFYFINFYSPFFYTVIMTFPQFEGVASHLLRP